MLTNEERRVENYQNGKSPTIASLVTPNTKLEDLNLDWREKDLPEKERTKHVHRLHPYLGKYIPQLVEIFLRKYFRPGQTVLDPFCGSGTTLVQANELGIHSIGYDISAFNVLLSCTKTAVYDIPQVKYEIHDILNKVRKITQANNPQYELWEPDIILSDMPETDSQYLKDWFAPQALKELLAYRYFIQKDGYKYKDLLKIILSRSARSARLTTHFDLDFPKKPQKEPYRCYKHSRICKPTEEAFKFIRRYSFDTIRRIEEFSALRSDAKISVKHEDAREANFPPIDGVITSPPYVGLIDYHEQHIYAYHLLGLKDKREKEIGSASNGSSQKAQQEYQIDIEKVFRRIARSMSSKGRMVVVANDRAKLYDKIAELAGMEVEQVVTRHVNRRTGRRSNNFYESVFVWKKL
ncbi:MAG: class I SAM-dependent methyltransferase [Deltaproteobacteria bacterium]|nr:class I SAM-dependent methyltransferase [Deltaproteobacteria bacterium]